MFIAELAILLVTVSWLFGMAFMTDVKNLRSMIIFKLIPFAVGLAVLFLVLVHLGWLKPVIPVL